jgi:hypothetical protein
MSIRRSKRSSGSDRANSPARAVMLGNWAAGSEAMYSLARSAACWRVSGSVSGALAAGSALSSTPVSSMVKPLTVAIRSR